MMDRKTEPVLCCGARTWSLSVGWFEVVMSSIALILGLISLSNPDVLSKVVMFDNDVTPIEAYPIVLFVSFQLIVSGIIGAVAGIILIHGVKEKNPKLVKAWCVLQCLFLVLDIFKILKSAANDIITGAEVFISILAFAITCFFILVVALHYQELKDEKRKATCHVPVQLDNFSNPHKEQKGEVYTHEMCTYNTVFSHNS